MQQATRASGESRPDESLEYEHQIVQGLEELAFDEANDVFRDSSVDGVVSHEEVRGTGISHWFELTKTYDADVLVEGAGRGSAIIEPQHEFDVIRSSPGLSWPHAMTFQVRRHIVTAKEDGGVERTLWTEAFTTNSRHEIVGYSYTSSGPKGYKSGREDQEFMLDRVWDGMSLAELRLIWIARQVFGVDLTPQPAAVAPEPDQK